ncbi:MAG: putative entry exclusion protein TrbK-alt [Erythrobacter sp.]|nr:putative entry exclusion protein TrbK-alt [Erythrobacter sp.]NCQ22380.1 putative entry exclusion protein TrbK-alt [Sphingomonadales bacterium]
MDGKPLARVGAAVFVGLAFAMTLVQLREEPAVTAGDASGLQLPGRDPLPEQLRACAVMGEAALSAPQCRAAWAEKRRRFLGVEHPEAFSDLLDQAHPPASQGLMPYAAREPSGEH